MGPHTVAGPVFVALALVLAIGLDAQAPLPTAGKARTDAELKGEAFFVKTCFLCHNPTNQTKELGIAVTDLVGLFKRPGVTEAYVRQLIREGIPGRMPGYRYTYTPEELDNLIAYLKIR